MPTATAAHDPFDERRNRLRLVEARPQRGKGLPPELVRAAALRADRSERVPRYDEADSALRLWEGLLSGQWTLLDWFDSDGRRLIIAKRTERQSDESRGLTKRQREVAIHAARGESSKCIGYHLGISPSRVSALLKVAMVKLGVRTKAQLVVMVRALSTRGHWSGPSTPASELNA